MSPRDTDLNEALDGNTPLDPDEREGLRFNHVTTRGELDELEQANIDNGIEWARKQRSLDILSEEFVRRLHRELFGRVWTWAGQFRRTEKNIGIDPLDIAIQLRELMEDARYWLAHQTFVPIELAARLHHRMVFIHPFPNGNGRHARIFADIVLTKLMGQPAINWAGGYRLEQMNPRRQQYIQALRAADGHDLSQLLLFVDPDGKLRV